MNTCISANNLPLYYMHIVAELFNTIIVFAAIITTFDERIDSDLLFFILYFFCGCGQLGLYLKKFLVHTKTLLTNETLHERTLGF